MRRKEMVAQQLKNMEQTRQALEQHFTPEFLGRLDQIVCFAPLTADSLAGIVDKYLRQLADRAAGLGIELILPKGLGEKLAGESAQQGGARGLRRLVQDRVEAPLSRYLLQCGRKITKLKAVVEGEKISFYP
jgi:ATP-dependent Clp protease ATP-binding subunit ClpB